MTPSPCELLDYRAARLLPRQRFVLREMIFGPAVLHEGRWRLKGAPAPKVTPFALATLLEMGLVREASPVLVELTATGKALARRIPAWA